MQGRKRVVSREVQRVEAANRQAAAMPADLNLSVARQPPATEAPTVVDPTLIGRRYRRTSHQKVYRWTQACSMGGALLAAISVICTMADEVALSRFLAGPALVLGVISIVLAGRNALAARWRGWAIAATVFAAVALSLTWILPAVTRDDPTELTPRQRLKADA